jgi:hypothetical protein
MNPLSVVGKGAYIWRPYNITYYAGGRTVHGDPVYIADKAEEAGVTHVAIKIHNGYYPYLGQSAAYEVGATIDELRKRGIVVGAWGYDYIKYAPTAEANTAIQVCRRYRPAYYLIDAETEAQGYYNYAKIFAGTLRAGLPDLSIGLASWWKPSYHPSFPFDQLRAICDFDSPQVYWRGYGELGKLTMSRKEYGQMTLNLPFAMPAGDMYYEHGIKPTPEQVVSFLNKCKEDKEIQAALMWSMDQMTVVPELWKAFSSVEWKDSAGTPLAEQLSSFLDGAKQDAADRGDFYQQLYKQHLAAGTLPPFLPGNYEENAVRAGVRKILTK